MGVRMTVFKTIVIQGCLSFIMSNLPKLLSNKTTLQRQTRQLKTDGGTNSTV